jgi:oxygen-dependent protoporphyrinogen oxidase
LRQLGDDFVDLLVYPLLAAYYGADPSETSAGVYHALARMGMDVSVYGAAGGFGELAAACLDAAIRDGGRFVPDTEVTAVRATGAGVEVETGGGTMRHDAAVIAVPAPVAARLVGGDALGAWLSRVRVKPTFTVAWIMDRPFPGDYFGLSFPRDTEAGSTVVALCIEGRKLSGLVPPGGAAIVALPAPAATGSLLELDDAGAAGALLEAVARVIPGFAKHVTATHVTRFTHGYTIFEPGYLAHLTRFDNGWLPSRVALAGDYLVAPSVEGAVRSGDRAATRVLEALVSDRA